MHYDNVECTKTELRVAPGAPKGKTDQQSPKLRVQSAKNQHWLNRLTTAREASSQLVAALHPGSRIHPVVSFWRAFAFV